MGKTDQFTKGASTGHATDELAALRARIIELESQALAARLTEEALRDSEELNRRIVESMQGGLVQIGVDGVFMWGNAEAFRILRVNSDAVGQTLVEDFGPISIHEDGTPYAVEDYPVSICLRTGKPVPPRLIGLRFPDETETWAVYSAAPIFDPQTHQITSAVVAFIDVTEQRKMQQSLRASEQRYRTLIETTATGYVVISGDGRVLDANAEYIRLTGHQNLLEIRGRRVTEWTAAHDLDRNAREVKQCAAQGYVRDLEVDYIDAQGNITPIEINATVMEMDGQTVILGLCRDITQRRKVERTIKASQEWFESLVHTVDGIVWEADAATLQFTFVSDKAEAILGYPARQWITEKDFWLNHMHPEDRETASGYCMRATADGRDHEFEYRMMAADGREVWLRDIVSLVKHNGKVLKLRGLMVDITASKQAQEQLRFQAALLASVRESVVGTDLDGRIIYWGRGAESLYGFTANDVLGKIMSFGAGPDEPRAQQHRRMLALQSGLWTGQHEQRRKNGSMFYGDTLMSLVTDHRGSPVGFITIDRDITEQRRYQDALRQSADTQRIMLSELDHRVRNNLASLAALIDISRRNNPSVLDFAESVKGRVQAMSAVHALLSRARWFAINLRSLIHTLIPVDLHEQVAVEGENVLIAPRQATALGMILQELTANSLKYGALRASSARITISWSVTLTDRTGERKLALTWRETGGTPVTTPPMPGQGSELIIGFARTELRGSATLTYPRDGAQHQFMFLLDPVN